MAEKRKSPSGTPTPHSKSEPSPKRQKTDDSITAPQKLTPSRPPQVLSAEEKAALKKWLDKKSTSEKTVTFPVIPIDPEKKGKKGKKIKATHEELQLHGRKYGEVMYTIGNGANWSKLTKYRKCTGKIQ